MDQKLAVGEIEACLRLHLAPGLEFGDPCSISILTWIENESKKLKIHLKYKVYLKAEKTQYLRVLQVRDRNPQ